MPTTHEILKTAGIEDIIDMNDTDSNTDTSNSRISSTTRIDAPVRNISYWQIMVYVGYLLMLGLLSIITKVVWWVGILLIIISLLVMAGVYLRQSPLIHITSPRLYQQQDTPQSWRQKQWQLLFDKPNHHELWEAELIQARDFGKCIHLNFFIAHPMPKLRQIVLWQDQIAPKSWRRLKVLARW